MKRIFIFSSLLCIAHAIAAQEKKDSFYTLTPVEVKAIRAGQYAPFTKTNLNKKDIQQKNLGRDIPFLLNETPAVVVNADAGNGIGYTGIRIRGADATRINITLNGIPFNDAESQGSFFVDLPDFSSSAQSIQIQRGVGTSSNGAGAFSGSINFSTNEVNKERYAEINNSIGSFNTRKHTLKAGTGLVNGFTTEFRLSKIASDGFIDRAASRLQSLYFTTAYIQPKTSFRINVFSGHEKTYQAWNGIPESILRSGNRTYNSAGTEKPGEPYKNEIDDYTQTHYQFFFTQKFSKKLSFNTALFHTKGKGFYEQYKADELYSKYGMENPKSSGAPITKSDIIRRLWLDNDFYGNIFSFQYKAKKTEATLGGSLTRYNGHHFGKVIWAENGLTNTNNWYDLTSDKNDISFFLKQQQRLAQHWVLFYDLQYRQVLYTTGGFRDNPDLSIRQRYHFFNPKFGASYIKNGWKYYASYSVAHKEPNRDDFEAGQQELPTPEMLHDWEAGVEQQSTNFSWAATLYYMHYKNQLVLTGKINDVGAYTRTNIPVSYRAGIELQGGVQIMPRCKIVTNLAISTNKIKNFTEYIDDYDNGGQVKNIYPKTNIAFSPSVVGNAAVDFSIVKNGVLRLSNKYVSRQFLDNTSQISRSLHPFFVQDISFEYTIKKWVAREIHIIAQLNNCMNTKYEPNGYTFSYLYDGNLTTENFYFPMAGRNFMLAVNISL